MIRAIFGAGGFAHDIRANTGLTDMVCFVDEEYYKPNHDHIRPFSEFSPDVFELIIGVGDPRDRAEIVKRLPKSTKYWSFIHPTARILGEKITLGEGSFVCAGCTVVCHSSFGKHTHLNIGTVIGHDSCFGDFCTTSPMAGIMGNCTIGSRVYFGANSCTRQKITICDDVTIGLGAGVVKDIKEPGIYVGLPAKKV